MKKNIIFVAVVGTFLLTSCADNLNIEQHGVVPIDEFYQTDEQVLSANAEEYNMFRAQPNGASTLGLGFWGSMEWAKLQVKEAPSDNTWAGGGARAENMDGYQISEWSMDSKNPNVDKYYTLMYAMVYRANLVLDRAPEGKSNIIDMCRAEALVFRAWAYFELTTLWGTPPIVDHVLTQSEYKVSNSTQAELYAFMEQDLKTAINSGKLVEKTSLNDRTTWRVTKQFAQALLGKVQLWNKEFTESANTFEEIINSGKYALFTEGEYGDMTHPEWNFNCESLFQTNRVKDENTSQGWRYTSYYFSPRGGMINWNGTGTELPEGMRALDYFETSGWGICVPTQDLYDAFVKEEGENGYRKNQTIRSYSQLQKQYGIRLIEGSMMLGDSVFMWKSRNIKSDRMGMSSNKGVNWTIMRYAEVLLCAAEANLLAGNQAKADTYLNMIRQRARLNSKSNITLEDIKIEKRLELCYEGTRLQDIQRWGDGVKLLGNKGADFPYFTITYKDNNPANDEPKIIHTTPYNDNSYGYKKGKSEWFPFPKTELDANPNIVQNPGY